MDDEDRYSASSGELDRDNDNDEVMDDADEDNDNNEEDDADGDDNDNDEDDNDNDNDGEGDADPDPDPDAEGDQDQEQDGSDNDDDGEPDDGFGQDRVIRDDQPQSQLQTQAHPRAQSQSRSQSPSQHSKEKDGEDQGSTVAVAGKVNGLRRPSIRPEAVTARLYDIVPTMAAPQATNVNAMAITPDLRYWFTGGSDGYIRKYDGPGTINGKLPLTVAQRHPFVDSVTKAGILMSYWENEEPSAPGRGDSEQVLSPVYSLAVHSDALWLLSGLESGGINLQSVRHDEGKKICCLQQHSNAVSVLTLAQDEKSVLSGSWDKNIFDWDLNTGQVSRSFLGSGGQISAIELRPASGDPIPAIEDEPVLSSTISTNNDRPVLNSFSSGALNGTTTGTGDGTEAAASPAHESLFGGSDAGSLFGETAGEQPFGHDDDDYNGGMNIMSGHEHEGGMDHSADMAMAGMEMSLTSNAQNDAASGLQPQPQPQPQSQSQPINPSDAMDIDKAEPLVEGQTPEAGPSVPKEESPKIKEPTPEASDVALEGSLGIKNEMTAGADTSVSLPPAPLFSPSAQSMLNSDHGQVSPNVFMSAAIEGTVRLWDRRVQNPVARIGNRPGVPPWCMSACWSPDGNMIYAGRRNGTVEEFDVRKAKRGWEPERVLRFPAGSGAISALKPMANGRHLVCASHDIMRLYDLRESSAFKNSTVPFLIIPGPPRAGVISSLYIDPSSRFMLSAAGTRGWEGTSTEVLIGYEINVIGDSSVPTA